MFKKLVLKKAVLAIFFASSFLVVAGFKKTDSVKAMQNTTIAATKKAEEKEINAIELADFAKEGINLSVKNAQAYINNQYTKAEIALEMSIVNESGKDKVIAISKKDVRLLVDKLDFSLGRFTIDASLLATEKDSGKSKFILKNGVEYCLNLQFKGCDIEKIIDLCPAEVTKSCRPLAFNCFKEKFFIKSVLGPNKAKLTFFGSDGKTVDLEI